jgi:hypothetical protein
MVEAVVITSSNRTFQSLVTMLLPVTTGHKAIPRMRKVIEDEDNVGLCRAAGLLRKNDSRFEVVPRLAGATP